MALSTLEPGPQGVLLRKNALISPYIDASRRKRAAKVVPEGENGASGSTLKGKAELVADN